MRETKIQAAVKAINAMPGRSFVEKETALAAAINDRVDDHITQWRVSKWRTNGVPVGFVLHVEAVTGVPRYELDPLIYPQQVA